MKLFAFLIKIFKNFSSDASQNKSKTKLGESLEIKPASEPKIIPETTPTRNSIPQAPEISIPREVSLKELIASAARDAGLSPTLVTAIIHVESSFREKAIRYEKNYAYLFKPQNFAVIHKITVETESQLQKFSYGLMQIMGATARECGYRGFLIDLCEPKTNLLYGCKFFQKLLLKYGNIEDAIASYNAGTPRLVVGSTRREYVNQDYVNKVLLKWRELQSADGNPTNRAPTIYS